MLVKMTSNVLPTTGDWIVIGEQLKVVKVESVGVLVRTRDGKLVSLHPSEYKVLSESPE